MVRGFRTGFTVSGRVRVSGRSALFYFEKGIPYRQSSTVCRARVKVRAWATVRVRVGGQVSSGGRARGRNRFRVRIMKNYCFTGTRLLDQGEGWYRGWGQGTLIWPNANPNPNQDTLIWPNPNPDPNPSPNQDALIWVRRGWRGYTKNVGEDEP